MQSWRDFASITLSEKERVVSRIQIRPSSKAIHDKSELTQPLEGPFHTIIRGVGKFNTLVEQLDCRLNNHSVVPTSDFD